MLLGWGIVGTGRIVDQRMVPALKRATNTGLTAVCSRGVERAESFAAKHGIEHAYDSLKKMLEDSKVDVVYIATPNSLHAQQTIQAAEAGKHVFCEKPMALTVPDAELMIEACNKNKVKLGIDFQNRYHPAHIEARRNIQLGLVGKINLAKIQFCSNRFRGYWSKHKGWRNDPTMAGAGALVNSGVHPIDLLRFLVGSEIEGVRALTNEKPPEYPVDDMVYVIMEFQNGMHAVAISGILVPRSDNDVVLYGSKAKITCKGTVGVRLQGELLLESDSLNTRMVFSTDDPISALYTLAVEAFNKCIEENTEPEISGYDGLEMIRITNAILESSREGKAIKIIR